MRVRLLQPFADGRNLKPGDVVKMTEDNARGMIDAGFAESVGAAAEVTVQDLAQFNAGLVYTDETDPDLLNAAKDAGLKIRKA